MSHDPERSQVQGDAFRMRVPWQKAERRDGCNGILGGVIRVSGPSLTWVQTQSLFHAANTFPLLLKPV